MLSRVRSFVSRAMALFRRKRNDRDFDAEVEAHLSMLADRFTRRGMKPDEARYAALRQFGGVAQLRQLHRESRGFAPLDSFLRDLSTALRGLLKRPAFSLTVIATIALGLGTNAAIFSVANAVLLKPLKAPDPDRIVRLLNRYPEGADETASFPQFNLWRQQAGLFEDVAAHRLDPVNLTGDNPEQIQIARVTAAFFHLFGARAWLGRVFTEEEDHPGRDQVAVLADTFWNRRFGRDPNVLGRIVVLGNEPYRIVGVLSPGFDTEQFAPLPDLWIPFRIDPATRDKGSYATVTARLKPGVSVAMANAQLPSIASEYRRKFPELDPMQTFEVELLQESMVYNARKLLPLWMGAVGLVLLIACANVANLTLARAAGRRREISIRAAIGAGRSRLVRQLLTESVVLSLCGGALGVGLGILGIRALLSMYPDGNPLSIPRLGESGSAVVLDWRVAGFTLLVSAVSGVLFGIVPALQCSRTGLSTALQESGRSWAGARDPKSRPLLVVAQMALALLLLAGAALTIRAYVGLRSIQPGFDASHVETLQMSLTATQFEKTTHLSQLVREGSARIRALPGVESAGAACCIPLETVWQLPFIIEGRALDGPYHAFAGWTFVSPDYFRTFKIPLLRGRGFTDWDVAGTPGVVVINQTMAQRFWPNDDPLKARLIIGRGMRPEYDKDPVRQIVGIVGDVRDQFLNVHPRPAMYVPIAQLPDGINLVNLQLLPIAWVVRVGAPSPSLMKAIEKELIAASAGLPVARKRTMDQVKARSVASTQFEMLLVTTFGSCALLLAVVGVYGVMACTVEQRTRELGIRLVLGAAPAALRNMVIAHAVRLVLTGVAIGAAGTFGLARLNLLFGTTAWEPVTLTAPVVLTTMALLAAWIPATRATHVDPVNALRWE